MEREELYRKASKGLLILFIGQLTGFLRLLPWEWISGLGTLAAFALSIVGLVTVRHTSRHYQVALCLYLGCVALWVALVAGLAAAAAVPVSGWVALGLMAAYTLLANVGLTAVNVLIVVATERLFHLSQDRRRERNAGLCWKLMLAVPALGILLTLCMLGLSQLSSGGALLPVVAVGAVPLGIAGMISSVLFVVVLWQGYDGLDEVADRMEAFRLEHEEAKTE